MGSSWLLLLSPGLLTVAPLCRATGYSAWGRQAKASRHFAPLLASLLHCRGPLGRSTAQCCPPLPQQQGSAGGSKGEERVSPVVLASQYLWSIPSHWLRDLELPPEEKENAVRTSSYATSAVTTVAPAAGTEPQPFQIRLCSHPPFPHGALLQPFIFAASCSLPSCQDPITTHCSL